MTDISKYRELLTEAVEAAAAQQRPARAAWLAQYIRHRAPTFYLRELGFQSFKDFVLAAGGFSLSHDGYDVVVGVGEAAPTPAQQPESHEKVHPVLWRAATRTSTGASYLDIRALREGRVCVVDELPPSSVGETERYVAVPVPSQRDQADWLLKWSEDAGLAAEVLLELREAISAGGIPRAISVLRARQQDRQFLYARVGSTRARLREWAARQGIEWGPPLVGGGAMAGAQTPPAARSRELRDVVRRALERLSDDELRTLRLPIGVVMDVLGEGQR